MLKVGDRIGEEWVVSRRLGSGGVGAVFHCRSTETGIDAAVKVLASMTTRLDTKLRNRLSREAEVLSGLHHDGIVGVTGWGRDEDRGLVYLVMEIVDGKEISWSHVHHDDGRLDTVALRGLLDAICRALAYAHDARIAHRDLKPANILVRNDNGRPVLVDWGSVYVDDDDRRLTRHQDSHGLGRTDLYAPPEALFSAAGADPFRWDVYAVGALIVALVDGESALHPGLDDRHQLMIAKTSGPCELQEGAPEALREVVRAATAPMPEHRPRSMQELMALIDRWSSAPSDPRAMTFDMDEAESGPSRPATTLPDPVVPPEAITSAARLTRPESPTAQDAAPVAETRRPVAPAPASVPAAPTPPPAVPAHAEPATKRPLAAIVGLAGVAAVGGVLLLLAATRSTPQPPPSEAPSDALAPSLVDEVPARDEAVATPVPATPTPEATPVPEKAAEPARAVRTERADPPKPRIEDAVAVVEPPAPTPKPTPVPKEEPPSSDPRLEALEGALATPSGGSARWAASDPARARAVVDGIARTWPDDATQDLAARTRRRLVGDMNAKVGDGNALVDTLASQGQLVRFLGSSQYGQAADFKVGLRLHMAERIPERIRAPTKASSCRELEVVVDVIGRAPVPTAHPWLYEACDACKVLTGSMPGKCGELDAP